MAVDVGALLLSLGLIGFGGLAGVLAGRLLLEQVKGWRQAQASRNWTPTAGRIVDAKLERMGVRRNLLRPHLEYEYHVAGRHYASTRRVFEGLQLYEDRAAQAILARYPAGQAVTVYYDPDQPSEATLERRQAGLASGLLIGLVLLFSPAAFCLITGLIGLRDAFVP